MSYDAFDRMTEATQDYSGTEQHAYNFVNRRVWRKFPSSCEYATFYGTFGEDVGD